MSGLAREPGRAAAGPAAGASRPPGSLVLAGIPDTSSRRRCMRVLSSRSKGMPKFPPFYDWETDRWLNESEEEAARRRRRAIKPPSWEPGELVTAWFYASKPDLHIISLSPPISDEAIPGEILAAAAQHGRRRRARPPPPVPGTVPIANGPLVGLVPPYPLPPEALPPEAGGTRGALDVEEGVGSRGGEAGEPLDSILLRGGVSFGLPTVTPGFAGGASWEVANGPGGTAFGPYLGPGGRAGEARGSGEPGGAAAPPAAPGGAPPVVPSPGPSSGPSVATSPSPPGRSTPNQAGPAAPGSPHRWVKLPSPTYLTRYPLPAPEEEEEERPGEATMDTTKRGKWPPKMRAKIALKKLKELGNRIPLHNTKFAPAKRWPAIPKDVIGVCSSGEVVARGSVRPREVASRGHAREFLVVKRMGGAGKRSRASYELSLRQAELRFGLLRIAQLEDRGIFPLARFIRMNRGVASVEVCGVPGRVHVSRLSGEALRIIREHEVRERRKTLRQEWLARQREEDAKERRRAAESGAAVHEAKRPEMLAREWHEELAKRSEAWARGEVILGGWADLLSPGAGGGDGDDGEGGARGGDGDGGAQGRGGHTDDGRASAGAGAGAPGDPPSARASRRRGRGGEPRGVAASDPPIDPSDAAFRLPDPDELDLGAPPPRFPVLLMGLQHPPNQLPMPVPSLLEFDAMEASRTQARLRLSRGEEPPAPLDVVRGVVTRSSFAAARLDCGGWDAVLPLSRVSGGWVRAVSDLFRPGDEVVAVVCAVDRDSMRLLLSTELLERAPGEVPRDAKGVFARSGPDALEADPALMRAALAAQRASTLAALDSEFSREEALDVRNRQIAQERAVERRRASLRTEAVRRDRLERLSLGLPEPGAGRRPSAARGDGRSDGRDDGWRGAPRGGRAAWGIPRADDLESGDEEDWEEVDEDDGRGAGDGERSDGEGDGWVDRALSRGGRAHATPPHPARPRSRDTGPAGGPGGFDGEFDAPWGE